MRRLIFYELKKLFFHWPVLLLLAVFTLLNGAKVVNLYQTELVYSDDARMTAAYHTLFGEYAGEMTEEKISSLMERYTPIKEQVDLQTATTRDDVEGTLTGNIHRDWLVMSYCFVDPMEYLYTYRNLSLSIAQTAKENYSLYTEVGNAYEAAKNRTIFGLYKNRSVSEFYPTSGFSFMLHSEFSLVLMALLILYGLCQAFSRDRDCGMDALLLTTPKGSVPTVGAKLLASMLYIAFVVFWFSLWDGVVFAMTFGLGKAGTLPVYAVESFSAASVNLTLNQYTALRVLCRLLGFWVLGMLFLLAARLCKQALLPFAAGSGIFLLAALADQKWGASSAVWAKVWNPFSLLTGNDLFGKTEFVNVGGTPVLSWAAAIIAACAVGVLAGALLLLSGRRGGGKR